MTNVQVTHNLKPEENDCETKPGDPRSNNDLRRRRRFDFNDFKRNRNDSTQYSKEHAVNSKTQATVMPAIGIGFGVCQSQVFSIQLRHTFVSSTFNRLG
jgi:hypothetical protein